VELTGFAFGGDCIGRLPDGKAVFVPFGLPGERVRVEILEAKRGFARGRLVDVLRPSPERVQPRCIHFGECGGCDYQHIPYERQLQAKREIVRDQLQRIGGIADPTVLPTVPCPNPYYYRNTIQFHQDESGRLGFIRHETPDVLAIQECHLPTEPLNATWPLLQLEPIEELDRVGLRAGAGEDVLLWLESEDPRAPELELDLDLSAVHLSPAGSIVMAGDDYLVMEVLGRSFRVSAGSFFQVNTPMAEAMVEHLLKHLPLTAETTLLDVYCGVGLFSAFLAPHVKRCIGIEVAESAVNDFAFNLDEFDNVELYQGPAEVVLPDLKVQADVALIDPPRAGLERVALDALAQIEPRFLAYVSCDAATLARDAKRLIAAGYRLDQTTPFDLFPQTYHVETISFFLKE
jgi:23S rRNA (uracil1939-C5)-methyltransferase